jgi:hypothetical protein
LKAGRERLEGVVVEVASWALALFSASICRALRGPPRPWCLPREEKLSFLWRTMMCAGLIVGPGNCGLQFVNADDFHIDRIWRWDIFGRASHMVG